MKTSAAGLAAIEAREGRRLVAYQDVAGVWTIGVGHTGRMAPPSVTAGMRITAAQCDALLAADLAPVETAIDGLKVDLTQNQFDALASFAFNIGVAGFVRSTVVADLKSGKVQDAADAMLLWAKPAVLKARRKAERAQFLKPDAPAVAVVAAGPESIAPATSGPSSAAASDQPTTKASLSMESIFAALPGLLGSIASNIGAVAKVGAVAPTVITGAFRSIDDAEKAIAAIEQLAADVAGAKWGGTVQDIEAILKEAVAILGNFGVKLPALAEAVAKLPDTPAVSTIKIAKAA